MKILWLVNLFWNFKLKKVYSIHEKFSLKDYCKKNICKNGGVCYANGEIEYCECVKGLSGNICELSIEKKILTRFFLLA